MSTIRKTTKRPLNFYWPDDATQTPQMRSPEYVQLSMAAAITLGLIQGRMHRTPCTHCLNLLVTYPEGCRANCSYCGLAQHREETCDYPDRNFIRVEWPTLRYADLIARVQAGEDGGQFERMCLSMITYPASAADTLTLLQQWRQVLPHIPASILSNPTTLRYADVVRLREQGADIFTVALDAATPEIFEHTRGKTVGSPHTWEHYWRTIEWAAEVFGPEQFGVHLIAGLGETEQEFLSIVQQVQELGGHSHGFAFFPEQGSLMEDWEPVPRAQWRRVQLGRFIIDHVYGAFNDMRFDENGQVIDFGLEAAALDDLIDSGIPFRTSGCVGRGPSEVSACNRPYGDSRPADIRSFPFALEPRDVAVVRQQMAGTDIGTLDPREKDED